MSKQSNVLKGQLEYRQFIVLEDGTSVQVRYNQDASLYEGTDVQLYEYTAKEGRGTDAKEVTRYAVAVEDAKRAKRTSTKETVASILVAMKNGMTPDELMQKFGITE